MNNDTVTLEEAIEYAKNDFLGIKEPIIKARENFSHLSIVKKQLNDISLNSDIVKQLYWIHYQAKKVKGEEKLEIKISCPQLADFIRNNLKYFFVRNNAKSGILRYVYLGNYYKLVSDKEFQGIIKSLIPMELQNTKTIKEVFELLETDSKFVPIEKLNTDQNIINFENGILDLNTGQLKPHSPDYLCTIRIPCNYKKIVPAPKNRYFSRFLNALTNNDPKVKRLILQVMGVVLSNVCGYKMKQGVFMVRKWKYR